MIRASRFYLAILSLSIVQCAGGSASAPARSAAPSGSTLDVAAERYVRLVLALGQHDEGYVDAYYGPAEWAEQAKAGKRPLDAIGADATALVAELSALPPPADPIVAARQRFLWRQSAALAARARIVGGERLSFDDESEALYDARAPHHEGAEFEALQRELESLLPGPGPLAQRVDAYRKRFIAPPDKLSALFAVAIEEARRRTLQHIPLPAGEAVILELVKDKTWGGYNWYKGGARSLIQINTDLPIFMARLIDVGAHESYPGHHVFAALLEQRLVRERGWVEYAVAPLYSPQALLFEGSANYGVDLVFPDAAEYLRDVLFPMAGLPPAEAEAYARVERLIRKLEYADNEAVRGYVDGQLTSEQARDYLVRYRLVAPERAEKYMAGADTLRSYVINYNLGQDLVRAWVERAPRPGEPSEPWARFAHLLSTPYIPSDLR